MAHRVALLVALRLAMYTLVLPATAAGAAWCVGSADSTTNVLRSHKLQGETVCAGQEHAKLVGTLTLARGESESIQLVLRPSANEPVADVHWVVNFPDIGAAGLIADAAPVGYVHRGSYGSHSSPAGCPFPTASVACPSFQLSVDCGNGTCVKEAMQCRGCSHLGSPVPTDVDWWPYIVLDSVSSFDVAPNSSQPLLLTVHAKRGMSSGTYTMNVHFSASDGASLVATVAVIVYDFDLPEAATLPSIWGLNNHRNVALWPQLAGTSDFQGRFVDFFVDHNIPVASLYDGQSVGFRQMPAASSVAGLRALWASGQRMLQVGASLSDKATDAEIAQFMNQTAVNVQLADSAGWPRNSTMVYVLDEASVSDTLALLDKVSAMVAVAFPGVKVVTCGNTQWSLRLGLIPGQPMQRFVHVDIFVPRCPQYANTSERAMASVRATGQHVGCYTSGIPSGEAGLNWFIEYPAIRSRLLVGAGAWKSGLEFFLYYRINGWTQYQRGAPGVGAVGGDGPLGHGVSRTMNVEGYANSNCSYDGEGQLAVPGPKGLWSTLHLENIRDGFDDHRYLALLAQLSPAGAAAAVPDSLFDRMSSSESPDQKRWSEDPTEWRKWRDAIARQIQAALRRSANGTQL